MTMPKVLTRKEAARLCKVSVATIDRAIERGDLPAKVYGGRTLIFESGVETFLGKMPDYNAETRNPRTKNSQRKRVSGVSP